MVYKLEELGNTVYMNVLKNNKSRLHNAEKQKPKKTTTKNKKKDFGLEISLIYLFELWLCLT